MVTGQVRKECSLTCVCDGGRRFLSLLERLGWF